MSRLTVTPKAFALLACLFLLVASIGCSPGTPIAPSSAPHYVIESPNFVRILSTSSDGAQNSSFTAPAVTKTISAVAGGTISNGRVTLEFPPHALEMDTEITIEMLNDGTLGVELGPHGTQFNHPVTMTMDLSGTTAEGHSSDTTTLWYNEDFDWWELIDKYPSGDSNVLSASLEHFSKFRGGVQP
ncbi:MAG: hypothetical protein ACYS0H_19185 [Planctomycetota bacterium]|jgi:hypothetical protein